MATTHSTTAPQAMPVMIITGVNINKRKCSLFWKTSDYFSIFMHTFVYFLLVFETNDNMNQFLKIKYTHTHTHREREREREREIIT